MRRIIVAAAGALFLAGLAAQGQVVPPPQKKLDQVKKIAVVEPRSVALNKQEIWVFVGPELMNPAREGYRLAATVLPAEATAKNVVWESSDPGVAVVDAQGNVRPVKPGVAVVRATTAANKISAECRVTVETMNRPSGSAASHLANRGYLARQGSWIYFADSARGMRLSKMRIDGSAKTPLSNDIPSHINVSGGTVYYVNNSDARKLYSVDIYGENRKWLNDSNPAYGAQRYGDEILYGSVGPDNRINLYRMNADGTGRRIVDWPGLGSVAFFHRAGDAAFYSFQGAGEGEGAGLRNILYRELEGGKPVTQILEGPLASFALETANMSGAYLSGRIFYVSARGEVRSVENPLDAARRKDRVVAAPRAPAKGLGIHPDWVFYYNDDALHKVRFDGREEQVLVKLPAGSTVWIYPLSLGPSEDDVWIYYYVLQTGSAPRLYKVRGNGLENGPVL